MPELAGPSDAEKRRIVAQCYRKLLWTWPFFAWVAVLFTPMWAGPLVFKNFPFYRMSEVWVISMCVAIHQFEIYQFRAMLPTALPGHCPNCGYDLRGNLSRLCPECGKDPTVPPSTQSDGIAFRTLMLFLFGAMFLATIIIMVGGVLYMNGIFFHH